MKKLLIYLSIIILLFVGLYVLNYYANGSSDNPYGIRESELASATRKQLNDTNYQNIILPDQMKSMVENKESGFVYFFASDCSYCTVTTPLLNPIAEQLGVDLPKFNLKEFQEGWQEYGITGTPTLVYFKDGVELDRISGGIELSPGDGGNPQSAYEQFLTKYKQE